MAISEIEKKAMDMKSEELDIFREMIMRYGIFDIETARQILSEKIKGKLSDTVIEMRDEE